MTQLTDKVLAIPVPDGAENIRVSQLIGTPKLFADMPGILFAQKLPPSTWRFLFATKSATEEDARKVVKMTHPGGFGRSGEEFKNYLNNGSVCYTAIDSLNTLKRQMELDPKNNYALIEKDGV